MKRIIAHGGRRKGAGRRQTLPEQKHRLAVGAVFDVALKRFREEKALRKYEGQPAARQIEFAQARSRLIPVKQRRFAKRDPDLWDEIGGDIEEVLTSIRGKTKGFRRFVSVPAKRIKDTHLRAKARNEAVSYCWQKFRVKISPRKAEDYLDEYRDFVRCA